MGGIGWMLEDHLPEIVHLWRRHLARELPGMTEPALGYATPVFLRELSRALRGEGLSATENPFRRCELLVKLAPREGLPGVVHEFRLLRRAIWEVLRAHGRLVPPQERAAADEKIDEAIAAAVGRLSERPGDDAGRSRGTSPFASRPLRPLPTTGARPAIPVPPRAAEPPTPSVHRAGPPPRRWSTPRVDTRPPPLPVHDADVQPLDG